MSYLVDQNKKFFIDKEFQIKPGVRNNHTLDPEGIEANEYGQKYAHKGDFIDKDGKVITLTGSGSELTFSADPVGILTETVNLTYGKQVGSILRTGEIDAEELHYPEEVEYDPGFNKTIEEKLPGIVCMLHEIKPKEE